MSVLHYTNTLHVQFIANTLTGWSRLCFALAVVFSLEEMERKRANPLCSAFFPEGEHLQSRIEPCYLLPCFTLLKNKGNLVTQNPNSCWEIEKSHLICLFCEFLRYFELEKQITVLGLTLRIHLDLRTESVTTKKH